MISPASLVVSGLLFCRREEVRILATRVTTEQLTLDGDVVHRTAFRFGAGEYDTLRELAEGHRMECEFHYSHLNPTVPRVLYIRPDREFYLGAPIFKYPFYDPWQGDDEEPRYEDTVCSWCNERGLVQEYDYGPEFCERCQREVIQRCPQNGWRSYFTDDPENSDEQCCVGCAQRFYFENGIPRDRLVHSLRFPCDFYTHRELLAAGFSEERTRYGREIVDNPDAFRRELLELIDSGKQIILDQGATGIGGGYPDWVTVWVKDTA